MLCHNVITFFLGVIISQVWMNYRNLPSCYGWKSESEVAQSCLTLCDPMDCSLPGSTLHGILQAGILEWVAISFSRGSSRPRGDCRPTLQADALTSKPPGKPNFCKGLVKWSLSYTTDVSTDWYRIFKDNLAVSIQMSREHALWLRNFTLENVT